MKKNLFITCLTLAVMHTGYAQEVLPAPGGRPPVLVDDIQGNRLLNLFTSDTLTDLTPEQQNKIKNYETEKKKKTLQIENLLSEKKARLHTLETADKPNMKALNKAIDEIAKLKADKMKAEAECTQKIRSLLGEEQRLEFDTIILRKKHWCPNQRQPLRTRQN